jgi:hypothetical protein
MTYRYETAQLRGGISSGFLDKQAGCATVSMGAGHADFVTGMMSIHERLE